MITDISQAQEFLTDERFAEIMKVLGDGYTLADLSGINEEKLEAIYNLAYQHYEAANYEKAQVFFQLLALLDCTDVRFFLGNAACLQAREQYEEAIDAYGVALVMDGMNNPEPVYNSAICLLKLGRKEDAIELLKTADSMGRADDERHQVFKSRCSDLLTLLKATVEGA